MTPPVLVQAAHAQWVSGTTITIPLASPTLAGSTVVIYNPSPSSATAISSIAAIAGVTPSAVVQSHVSRNAEIWAAVNVAAGAISVTVTLVGTGNTAVEPYVVEWSGVTAIDDAGDGQHYANRGVRRRHSHGCQVRRGVCLGANRRLFRRAL